VECVQDDTPILQSSDLTTWKLHGSAFTDQTRPDFEPSGGLWAPDINYINGQYVLFYSMSKWEVFNEFLQLSYQMMDFR
jgi:arabinan endo-1,5-alpha-L-arabinosidase